MLHDREGFGWCQARQKGPANCRWAGRRRRIARRAPASLSSCRAAETGIKVDYLNLKGELADPRYRELLVFRDALSSSARATFAALLQQYDQRNALAQGWQFLQAVDANTKRYHGSGALLFQAIGRKEAAISFAVLNAIVHNKMNHQLPTHPAAIQNAPSWMAKTRLKVMVVDWGALARS
ncbi:MAG: hypothetical protein QNJ22_18095 [Desulfosarcinaceae bacterium]|nr:hypothetical protein [Desulfosarcinaceae bacterium]